MSNERLIGDEELPEIEAAPTPDDASLKSLATLASRYVELTAEIEQVEAQLAQKQVELRLLEEQTLPTAMLAVGMESFALAGGGSVALKEDFFASIPSNTAIKQEKDAAKRTALIERRAAAFAWLRNQGHEAIIKNEFTMLFGKGDEPLTQVLLGAIKAHAQLAKLKNSFEETVHAATLKSFVESERSEGRDVPEDIFGIYTRRRAVVTPAGEG